MAENQQAEADGKAEEWATHEDGLALGVRHPGHERRAHERRTRRRPIGDRRRGERRRRRLRTLLLAAATLVTPTQKIRPILAIGGVIGAVTAGKSRLPLADVAVSIDDFRAIPPEEAYEHIIQEAAEKYKLDPALIRAVMRTESSFNPQAVSPVGAQGLMQLMPALAKEMGVTDPFDPRQNIMAGARYLRRLLDAHEGNLKLTLASYNAGPGNVARYKGIPPFRETRNYVQKITDLLEEAATEE